MTGHIAISAADGVCTVTLRNEARRNAMSRAMWERLQGFAESDEVSRSRVVVLRGEGNRAFSAGADVTEFQTGRSSSSAAAYDDLVEETCRRLEAIPIPTIALIKGACMGAGASLAASCDLRVASDDAFFAVPAARLGLGYDPRGVDRFCRVFGQNLTRLVLFTASKVTAVRAYECGAVHALAPLDEIDSVAHQFAQAIRDNAPLTIKAAKLAIRAVSKNDKSLRKGAERLYRAADASADYAEGRAAFAEKRPAKFTGK
jgi:enoyl-CoA hydratase/carnithine racemase